MLVLKEANLDMIINPTATVVTPPAPQQHEPGAPSAILQAVGGTLTRRGYTVITSGLSTALELAGSTGPAARAVGILPRLAALSCTGDRRTAPARR